MIWLKRITTVMLSVILILLRIYDCTVYAFSDSFPEESLSIQSVAESQEENSISDSSSEAAEAAAVSVSDADSEPEKPEHESESTPEETESPESTESTTESASEDASKEEPGAVIEDSVSSDAEIEEVETDYTFPTNVIDLVEEGEQETTETDSQESAQEESSEATTHEEIIQLVDDTHTLIGSSVLEDGGICRVTINYTDEAEIPADAELSIKEISGDPEKGYTQQVEDEFEENVLQSRFFDICIIHDGQEIQPAVPVDVRIDLMDELEDAKVLHFSDDNNIDVIDSVVTANDNTDSIDTEDEEPYDFASSVDFKAESFSVYAVVVSEELETSVLCANGDTYQIHASFDQRADIPSDAVLTASEITPDDPEYTYYMENVQDLYRDENACVNARFFDISIMSGNVNVQPERPVEIRLSLDQALEDPDVLHFADEEIEHIGSEAEGDAIVFEAASFSVYSLVETTLTRVIEATDGNSYEISVSYDNTVGLPMNNTSLSVSELLPGTDAYDGYAYDAALSTGADVADLEFLRAFDIKITDENDPDVIYEPSGAVDVSIRLLGATLDDYSNVEVMHFTNDGLSDGESVYMIESEINGDTVGFVTDGFSVYVITSAPEPPSAGTPVAISSLAEFNEHYNDASGFFLAYNNGQNYFTNNVQSGGVYGVNTNVNAAGRWFFEPVTGQSGKFYIYTLVGGVPKYMVNTTGNEMGLSQTEKTAFEITSPESGKFLLKVVGQNKWLQYSNGGKGIRLYTESSNATNARISFIYASSVSTPYDYYGFDGETFSLAYLQEGISGYGCSNSPITISSRNGFRAERLYFRPDVLGGADQLLLAQDFQLADWKFTCIEGDKYYMTTKIGRVTYYLTCDNSGNLSLSPDPSANAIVSVASGTDSYAGKYKLNINGYNLAYAATGGSTWFRALGGNDTPECWLTFVSESQILSDADFAVYSAEKVDLSDRTVVPDGAEVVVYARIWNPDDKRYDFYAINHDGSVVRVFENGDMIQWVGSAINTLLWDFTEYHYEGTDTPNYYYELQNQYSGKYIAPQITDNQTLSDDKIGVNLNGRRYGRYFSQILAWDNDGYAYTGIRINDDKTAIEACSLKDADNFYVAIMKPLDLHEHLNTVATLDNNDHGISIKMIDFADRNYMSGFLHNDTYVQTEQTSGILSTNLVNGYPTVSATGQSLAEMYTNPIDVNHLFIENTYYASGYYEFNSLQNTASFYDENGVLDPHNFTVYSELVTTSTNGNKNTLKHGQFLPYNWISDNYSVNNPYNTCDAFGNELPDSDPRKGEPLRMVAGETDYQFGLELEASFTQTESGLDAWGHDIIYEFTGDDDFWLYVDGELVIDLGGVHGALPGNINYRTGQITVNGETDTLRNVFRKNYVTRNPNATEAEINDFLGQYFEDGETVFKDYTSHTMRIFYMERGAGASNLHIRFNLASVLPGTIVLSKSLSGTEAKDSSLLKFAYQIHYRTESEGGTLYHLFGEDPDDAGKVMYKDSDSICPCVPSYTPPGGTESYSCVYFVKPGESIVADLPRDTIDYYITECAVNPTIYDDVSSNGVSLPGALTGNQGRYDYSNEPMTMSTRPENNFENHVADGVVRNLTFTKKLYDSTGQALLHYDAEPGETENKTTFDFRLYLADETDSGLSLANMYSYHVKNRYDEYCTWDAEHQKFVSTGITDHAALAASSYHDQALFNTSINGAISKIPADYTVEVRDLIAGTKWSVEERLREIPVGYTMRLQDGYTLIDGATTQSFGTTPVVSTITPGHDPELEVRNQRGWGITVEKKWSDSDFMAEHDPVYFAVYVENEGTYTLLNDSVMQLPAGADSVYYFFGNLQVGIPFDKYVVFEVTLSGNNITVDSDGKVSGYTDVHRLEGTDTLTIGGTPEGGEYHSAENGFTYNVSYVQGQQSLYNENLRTDTVTNSRPGYSFYKTDWDGTPLPGAVFTLKDGNGDDVAKETYTSGDTGLITTAYLDAGTYTLEEISAPRGYVAMSAPMTITVQSDHSISVSGIDSRCYSVSTNPADGMFASVTIKDPETSLRVIKTSADTDEPLEGVHFALYREVRAANGVPRRDYLPMPGYEDMTTDANGLLSQLTVVNLRPGVYYLSELSTLEDYAVLDEDVRFGIEETGNIIVYTQRYTHFMSSEMDYTEGVMAFTLDVKNELQLVDYYNIYVSKTVTGNMGDKSRDFNFTLTLLPGSYPLTDEILVGEKDGVEDDYEPDEHGVYHFTLSHGQTIMFKDIPEEMYYAVSESVLPGAGYRVEKTGDTGTIVDSDVDVFFTNTRDVPIPTSSDIPRNMGVMCIPFCALGAFLYKRRLDRIRAKKRIRR